MKNTNTNTNTNTSFFKKVGFGLLFSIFAFSNYGVKGQGFIVRAKTELITNVSATRYTGTTKYVVRFYAATSSTQTITRTLSKLAIEYSFNNTIIYNPQVYLVRDGNEFVASNILTAPTTQGNYSIAITNPTSSITNHTRVKVAATRASNPSNTNLDIVATTQNPTSEFMRVYFDVPVASQRPVDNSPVYSNPSFTGYLASVPTGGYGTAPLSPATTPWLLWSYSDINTTD